MAEEKQVKFRQQMMEKDIAVPILPAALDEWSSRYERF